MVTVYTVDEEKMNSSHIVDIHHPPVKAIEGAMFPRVVYKHPPKKYKRHVSMVRGQREEEIRPAEHVAKLVKDETELEAALVQGWKKEAYIPADLPEFVEDINPKDVSR